MSIAVGELVENVRLIIKVFATQKSKIYSDVCLKNPSALTKTDFDVIPIAL